MDFEYKYKKITQVVAQDLDFLESGIREVFNNNSPLDKDLFKLLTAPAKRLRPLLGMLFLRALFGKITPKQYEVLLAVELVHNATLIHDDVIDKSDLRRKQETLNSKFGNNLAVIAGDFLLTVAMDKIISTDSIEVLKLFTSALKATCLGEINQHFSKFKVTSIEEYLEKSKNKTALLFEIAILSGLYLSDKNFDKNLYKTGLNLARNFGIAFQIRDDIINLFSSKNGQNVDINCGIYTAPVIFAYEEDKNILNSQNILDIIPHTRGVEKSKHLMENYFGQSISAIEDLEDNIYKHAIIELIELFKLVEERI